MHLPADLTKTVHEPPVPCQWQVVRPYLPRRAGDGGRVHAWPWLGVTRAQTWMYADGTANMNVEAGAAVRPRGLRRYTRRPRRPPSGAASVAS
jgi:hypothetical protein